MDIQKFNTYYSENESENPLLEGFFKKGLWKVKPFNNGQGIWVRLMTSFNRRLPCRISSIGKYIFENKEVIFFEEKLQKKGFKSQEIASIKKAFEGKIIEISS